MFAFHSANGQEFVGLRTNRSGQRQVVYDHFLGRRVIIDINDDTACIAMIREALLEGIKSHNVWTGTICALQSRNILYAYTA